MSSLFRMFFAIIGILFFRFNAFQFSSIPSDIFLDKYGQFHNESLYNKVYAKYTGDIYIAGLFSMHHMESTGLCRGLIDQDGLQVLAAAIYGIKIIEKLNIIPLKLGLLAIDTCQSIEYVMDQSKTFLQFKMSNIANSYTCPSGDIPQPREELENFQNVFGVFGAGNSDVSIEVSKYLRLVSLPQLSFFSTSTILSEQSKFPTFFRTIPSDKNMIKAIIHLLKRYNWNYLLVINDNSEYSQELTNLFNKNIDEVGQLQLCVAGTFTILKSKDIKIVEWLQEKVNQSNSARVIVTLLTQPKAEDLFRDLNKTKNWTSVNLLWIATDSWGGRDWDFLRNSKTTLNNTIAVVPKVYFDNSFKSYYVNRLPSEIDSDPWLAEAFENFCSCQYKNRSLFIYLELRKMRPVEENTIPCETLEKKCSHIFYRNFTQMLYIHYVIDGIFAYAYSLAKLIPNNCTDISPKMCVRFLFKNGLVSMEKITETLKNITFTDSTGERFKFWNGTHDGIPNYSIVKFEQNESIWSVVGNISEHMEFKMSQEFDEYLKTSFNIPPCNKECSIREAKFFEVNKCCWKCSLCLANEIISTEQNIVPLTKRSFIQQSCKQCQSNQTVIDNTCIGINATFMSFKDDIAISIILMNMLGLCMSLVSLSIMVIYWKTPIIKAFGRETSSIILAGTMLSFAFSILLLHKPTNVFCYLRWCSPGLCSTICYAAILTKTNRIARIFGIKFTASKKATPRFISPISQINIVLIITAAESCILIVVMITSKIEATTMVNNVWNCYNIETSSVLAIFLIPSILLIFSTVYAFKVRKTPDGFNETRNINFLNFTNCVVLVTCLLLHQVLKDKEYSVIPFCILLTLGGHGNLMGLFIPKIYIILFRPNKNTMQAIITKNRTRSQVSFSHSTSVSSNLEVPSPKSNQINLDNLRCRKCNFPIINEVEMDSLAFDHANDDKIRKTKVNFSESRTSDGINNEVFDDFPNISGNRNDNINFISDK